MGLKEWLDGLVERREIPFSQKLTSLERRREELVAESRRIKVYNILFPLLFGVIVFPIAFFTKDSSILTLLALPLIYLLCIPLKLYYRYRGMVNVEKGELIKEAKYSVFKYFMSEFHPEIDWKYGKKEGPLYKFLKPKFPDGFMWILDEIKFENEQSEISLAGLELSKRFSGPKYFRGLILRIKLDEENFPIGEIKSRKKVALGLGLEKKEWKFFKKFQGSDLSYFSSSEEEFLEGITPILPIIEHLSSKAKGIRVILDKNEISIFLETDKKFLDETPLKLEESFKNEKYYLNLAKKINTFLFIVESLTKNLEKSEVEERLELKVLSMVPNEMIL